MRTIDQVHKSLGKRYAAERRFRMIGLMAIMAGLLFLLVLFVSIVGKGYSAFTQTYMQLEVELTADKIDPEGKGDIEALSSGDYGGIVKAAMRQQFPWVKKRKQKRKLYKLVSNGATYQLREAVMKTPSLVGQTITLWVPVDDDADMFFKGHLTDVIRTDQATSIKLEQEGRDYKLIGENAEVFAGIRQAVQENLSRQLVVQETEQAYLLKKQTEMNEQMTELKTAIEAAREAGKFPQVEVLQARYTEIQAELDDLRQRIQVINTDVEQAKKLLEDVALSIDLPREMPSYLVAINGGYLKLKSLNGATAKATPLVPLSKSAASASTESSAGWQLVELKTAEKDRRLADPQAAILLALQDQSLVKQQFNTTLFTAGDSREPELAGIASALKGTMYMLIVTLLLSFPIGVATAVYLEEFAPQNRWTDFIEVNINNLAAVPSIIFGLLGLAIFINIGGLPRSAPLVGGLVLTLMTLPTIIIAGRAALKAVPPSIREAALGIGASRVQMVFYHVLPLALPGMLTGTIIGMAQALGESAPLLMIGMVAFIVDVPQGFVDPATALPVQIYLWADSPERAFVERTSAAIMVLLGFLVIMNAIAVILRKRFERRW